MGNARGGRGAAKPGKGILRTTGHSLNSQEASQPYSQNLPLTQGMSQVCSEHDYYRPLCKNPPVSLWLLKGVFTSNGQLNQLSVTDLLALFVDTS
jgi:hypothetical protein